MAISDRLRRRFWGSDSGSRNKKAPFLIEHQIHQFSIRELRSSTQNFSPEFLIGRGGSSNVYSGSLVVDGEAIQVAIKHMRLLDLEEEFWNEIQILSKLKHKNVVPLIGYCSSGQERLLVYKYMPQGSLYDHLHRSTPDATFSWEMRLSAAIGAAHGLDYLHRHAQHRIIHRDPKSSNILLDENWVAKISDFGSSKIVASEYGSETHVSTLVRGTLGYLDPEYFHTSQLTAKSDVYAFGVVLWELLSGMKAMLQGDEPEHRSLVSWALFCIREGRQYQLIDQTIVLEISPACLKKFMNIAERCICMSSQDRPTMADVVTDLELALALQRNEQWTDVDVDDRERTEVPNDDDVEEEEHTEGLNGANVDEEDHDSSNENSLNGHTFTDSQPDLGWDRVRKTVATSVMTLVALVHITASKLQPIWEHILFVLLYAILKSFRQLREAVHRKFRQLRDAKFRKEEIKVSERAKRHCRCFSLAEIVSATRNFSDSFVIGRGGFGKIYKGLIDEGQQTVAIKRLKSNSKQGLNEFKTEIETLSELQHFNVISLIGYCYQHGEMILVYEYMAQGSLADHLYKRASEEDSSSPLSWEQLLEICINAGRGLDYLHSGRGVIHRDVKTSNILLDVNITAKVSDFGLAKHENRNKKLLRHVSTRVKGTPGYFDPDYTRTCRLTRKSDTYAFGVVLLEVLCGRPAMDRRLGVPEEQRILAIWARESIRKGEVDNIIATSLRGKISPNCLKTYVETAEKCLLDEPNKRPTMAQVVAKLEFALEQQGNTNSPV